MTPNCSLGKESGLQSVIPRLLMSTAFWCLYGSFPGSLEGERRPPTPTPASLVTQQRAGLGCKAVGLA